MTKIIGLCGKKGSGKTTVAVQLCHRYGFARLSLAQPMKDMLLELLKYQGMDEADALDHIYDPFLKEQPLEQLCGNSPRLALQTLGTEWGRELHEDFWVRILMEKAKQYPLVVVDDVRFPNEQKYMNWVVKINRPNVVSNDTHSSENAVLHYDVEFLNKTPEDPERIAREINNTLF